MGNPMSETSVTQFVRVGPTLVRVRTVGQGKPLLLLMGIGGSLDMWEPLAQRLPGRRLVMFDFPGTGGSTLPWLPPTMLFNAVFVRLLIKKLSLGSVDVLGYSWGGLLAQQLAIQHPRSVRRLVLACTSYGAGSAPASVRTTGRMLTPRRYYSASYLEQIAPTLYGGRFRRDPGLVADEARRRTSHPPSATGYLLQLLAAATYSSLFTLPLISARTLILAGDDDPLIRTVNQRVLGALIRRSTVKVLPEAGHLFLLDSPETAAPLIEDFLAAP
jgi:pimeloyl-ACP methyl ester carboxylesterase